MVVCVGVTLRQASDMQQITLL